SASKAMSATPRVECPAFWPTPCCQLGMASKLLGLPPVPLQTVSPVQLEPDVLSVVPPTETTYCEAAGQLGSLLPSPHSSAPLSPEDTAKVCPCDLASWKIWSSAAATPLFSTAVSQAPSET